MMRRGCVDPGGFFESHRSDLASHNSSLSRCLSLSVSWIVLKHSNSLERKEMWGQLAGRVAQSVKENAGDLRSTMARIGDVVAPPPGEEEDEEYEEYEDDDDDGDDEYEEEEYTDEEDDSNQPMAGGGLGALLSPFLDRKGGQKAQYDEEESEEEEAEEEDQEETWKESVSSTKPQTYGEIEASNLTSSLSSSSATQPTSVQEEKAVPPTKTAAKVVDSSKKLIVSKASTHHSTAQNTKLSSTSRKEEGGSAQRVALSHTEPKGKASSSVPSNQRPKSGAFTQQPTQPRADAGSTKQEKAPEKQRPVGKLSNNSVPPNNNLASKGREEQAKRRAQTRDEKTGAGSVSSLKSQSHATTANGKSTSSRPMSMKEMVSKKEPSQAVKPKQEKKDPRQAAKQYQEKVSKKSGPTEMPKSGGKPTASSSSSSSVKELVQPAIDTTRMVSSPAKPSKVLGDTSSPMVSYLMSDEPVDPNAKTPKASSTSPYMRQKTERKEPSPLLQKKTVAAATTASRSNKEPSKARPSHQATTTQVQGKGQRKQQVSSTSQKSAETESPNKTLKPYAAQKLSIPDLNLQPDMDLTTRPAAEGSLTHLAESSERRVPSNVLHEKEPTQFKRDDDEVSATKLKDLQSRYQRLERDLKQREQHILDLQREAAKRMEEEEEWRQSHVLKFKQEQAQMVEAMTESVTMEHRQAMRQQRQKHELEMQQMEEARDADAAQAAHDQAQLKRLLDEAQARIEATETDKKKALNKQGAMASQMQQRKEQAVRRAEEKLAETMAQVDMKQEEIQSLKKTVKELKATLAKKKRGEEEVEEELEHLRSENDTLHHNWQVTEEENEELKKQLEHFESRENAIKNLQEKLKKLENERVLEKAQKESAMSSAASNQANVEAERDAALAHCRDLDHQLTAALADVEVARADTDRALLGNANLNKALAAFQAERDAEMALWEEQHHSQEEATAAAHAAALEATHAANESKMREVKGASDRAVKAIQSEVSVMQSQLEVSFLVGVEARNHLS